MVTGVVDTISRIVHRQCSFKCSDQAMISATIGSRFKTDWYKDNTNATRAINWKSAGGLNVKMQTKRVVVGKSKRLFLHWDKPI